MSKGMSQWSRRKLAQIVVREAEAADAHASASDGPVPPTWECMDASQRRRFFRAAYLLAKKQLDQEDPS